MRFYGAIAVVGGWTVGYCHGLSWHQLGDVRLFASFEDADQCARDIAAGKYWFHPGQYVNLR